LLSLPRKGWKIQTDNKKTKCKSAGKKNTSDMTGQRRQEALAGKRMKKKKKKKVSKRRIKRKGGSQSGRDRVKGALIHPSSFMVAMAAMVMMEDPAPLPAWRKDWWAARHQGTSGIKPGCRP